ncbi:MAG: DMT family transporter [Bdellovibrio sp.]
MQIKSSSSNSETLPRSSSVWLNPWVWICGTCFFLHLWTYKLGALNTSIANMMILFSTNPLWTALGSRLWLKQKLTAWHFASYALALFGLVFLFRNSWSSGSWNRGDFYSLITAFFYSAYVQTSYQARKNVANLNFAMGIYFIGCFGFFVLCYLHADSLSSIKSSTVLAVLGLVLFPTLCGHFNFTYLVRHLNLNWMSSGKLVEPVLSSLMAAWLFKEGWDHSKSIAFAFTAASVLVLIWSPRNVQKNEVSSSGCYKQT